MPTYIVLFRYTQKGIENIKQSPARVKETKEAFRAMGAEIKGFYLVTGQYDTVLVTEAPDDETITKLTLALGSQGNVRTETLRAFTEDEFGKIIAALS